MQRRMPSSHGSRLLPLTALSSLAVLTLLLSCSSTGRKRPSSETLEGRLRALAEDAIARRVFPGCSILAIEGEQTLAELIVGHETYAQGSPRLTKEHRFDLASLTKVVATTPVAMVMNGLGRLPLDRKLSHWFPAYSKGEKSKVTVGQLLAHCSGLPAWRPLYKDPRVRDYASGVGRILALPLESKAGEKYRYSDLGMILLACAMEREMGGRLDRLARFFVFARLGMNETSFGPIPASVPCVPTEVVAERGGLVRGVVHDENAAALGGIAGHAGLFSTARDLAKYLRCILRGGTTSHGRVVLPKASLMRFTQRANLVQGSSRAYGFDTPSGRSSSGTHFSAHSIGHTGFTGTSFWVDLDRKVAVILLSNRVHPTRKGKGIAEFRRKVADCVMQHVLARRAGAR